MSYLYQANTLSDFWRVEPEPRAEEWAKAVKQTDGLLPQEAVNLAQRSWADFVKHILGEGQFGADHWQLSRIKRLYYDGLRPLLPRQIRPVLRWLVRQGSTNGFTLSWPIEDRYVRFLHAVLEAVQEQHPEACPAPFWPAGARFAFILTHDVESANGQAFVRGLADLEERYSLRSSFNFVPEGYRVDQSLLAELRKRGFEIGVHGLKHDGRLFTTWAEFERQAGHINGYLGDWDAVGFRSPFTHRNPQWMQCLAIEYDSSFFDTDPYETIPGGTMSIWPFFCGRFMELPYTLVQDSTLFESLGHRTAKLWLDKVDFIAQWGGMALMNVHPDYMRDPSRLAVYEDFLRQMSERAQRAAEGSSQYYWHALPREVARWWRTRSGFIN